jgi:predicted HicB family RNase H-like nuclease
MDDTEHGNKAPMGRPPLMDGEAKSARLALRLRPRRLERIQQAACRSGMKVTQWVEQAIDAMLKKENT